jgi:uncharacterized membrane protein
MNYFGFIYDNFTIYSSLLVLSICAASSAGLIISRHIIGEHNIRALHDVAGHYLTVVSTIYAVTLGLIVFDSLGTYQGANVTVKNEARSLAAIYTISERYPDRVRKNIQGLVYGYVDAVISSEWSMMAKGEECPLSRKLMHDLMMEINSIEPETPSQLAVLPVITQESILVMDSARQRLQESSESMPSIEWICLLLGAFVTIFFTYFFTTEKLLQVFMLILVSSVIATNLILVMAFGNPYSGAFHVSDGEFRQLKAHIESLH